MLALCRYWKGPTWPVIQAFERATKRQSSVIIEIVHELLVSGHVHHTAALNFS